MHAVQRDTSLRFRVFKYAVYALLACNVLLFQVFETSRAALDGFAWLILLAAFEYETTALHEDYVSAVEKYGLWTAQIAGYALAVVAAWLYLRAAEWPSLVNSLAWLMICAVLAYDVHVPGAYGGLEWIVRNALKLALYGTVGAVALWFGWQGFLATGDWVGLLDFYDAGLWILCFVLIETNILIHESRPGGALSAECEAA